MQGSDSQGPGGLPFPPEDPTDPSGWSEEEATVFNQALSSGTFFGDRFRLGSALGSGAMGRVIQAWDHVTGREVALKVLHKDRARDAEQVERFRREASILEAIGHPGIVRIIAMGNAPDGTPWLAMELLRGETVKQRIQRGGPIDVRAILPILNTLCDALAAAHIRGIVHRDLKPENILLLPEGSEVPCKILDFGLSRFTAAKTLTRTGTMLGTPRYMSPEQIKSASSADHRTDVFSAGVLLYEMLVAKSPYPADDLGQLLGCVLEGRVVPLEKVRPDLPPLLGEVIRRAMAMEPSDRFQTAGAVAEAFANALGISSGRSGLGGSPMMTATIMSLNDGSAPLVDPFAADPLQAAYAQAAPAKVESPLEPTGDHSGLAQHPLLATMVPGHGPAMPSMPQGPARTMMMGSAPLTGAPYVPPAPPSQQNPSQSPPAQPRARSYTPPVQIAAGYPGVQVHAPGAYPPIAPPAGYASPSSHPPTAPGGYPATAAPGAYPGAAQGGYPGAYPGAPPGAQPYIQQPYTPQYAAPPSPLPMPGPPGALPIAPMPGVPVPGQTGRNRVASGEFSRPRTGEMAASTAKRPKRGSRLLGCVVFAFALVLVITAAAAGAVGLRMYLSGGAMPPMPAIPGLAP